MYVCVCSAQYPWGWLHINTGISHTWHSVMLSLLAVLLQQAMASPGLEDLGIGYCHTEGVGWNHNVTAQDILEDDWVIVDAAEHIENNDSLVETAEYMDVGVYWKHLVRRPECVDKITIKVGNITQATIADPADFSTTRDKIIVKKKICETEMLNIDIANWRGGFDAHLSNIRLIRRQPDELFNFNHTMFGILDKEIDFINKSSTIRITQNSVNRISLSWNKDIFTEPKFKACLTSAELVDDQGLVIPLNISAEDVVVTVDECSNSSLTVRYRYQDTVVLRRLAEVPALSHCFNIPVLERSQIVLGLGISLIVLLVLVMMIVCYRILKKNMDIGASEVPPNNNDNNRANIPQQRNVLPEIC